MLLEQICPGQVNPERQSIHIFVGNNTRYIAYGSGSKVVIYADPNIFIQVLSVQQQKHPDTSSREDSVVAITSHSQMNKLAVAFGSRVELFIQDPETQKWKSDSIIDTNGKITCLDWNIDGEILVGGEKLQIWRQHDSEWDEKWSSKTPTPTMLALFSPNASLFATVGQFDQLVTIWYRGEQSNESGLTFDFVYLSHPLDVTYFSWRRLPPSASSSLDCTLFTMCRDGVGRFWSPTDINVPYRLYMCAVIDPSQSLVTADSSTSIYSSSHHSSSSTTSTTEDHHHSDEFSPIHYIGCDELRNALSVCKLRECSSKHPQLLDHQLEKVKDLVRDTPDLLFRLQPDGSIIFWGVQYLNSWPRRIPRTFVMLRIDQAISPKDGAFFLQNVNIVHDYAHVQSLSTIKPVELSLVARNPHGELRYYGLNLVDFLDTTSFEPRLRLKCSWVGHQQPIASIHQAHSDQLFTISLDGYLNVWKYGLYQNSGHLTTQLILSSSTQLHHAILSTPIDHDNLLAVYNGKHVLVYNIGNHDCHLHQHQEMPLYDSANPLSSLFALKIDDNDSDNGSGNGIDSVLSSSSSSGHLNRVCSTTSRYLLFGVSSMKREIYTWEISNIGQNEKLCTATYRGCQRMPWETEPTVISPSNDRWAGGTTSELLYKLATSTTNQDKDGGLLQTTILAVGLGSIIYFYGFQGIATASGDNDKNEDHMLEWQELYQLDTGIEKTLQVCCVSNTIAIVSQEENSYKLSIWMEMRTNMAPSFVKSFDFAESIQDIAWCVSSDAQFFLAVALQHKVSIYGQQRATDINGDADVWTLYTDVEIDTEQIISGVAWVNHGVLVVTAGNQVRCYQKWLTTVDDDPLTKQQDKSAASLYDLSYDMNGPLPLYHPRHLLHYLLWGKVELINTVLLSLLGTLRYLADANDEQAIEIAPPFSLERIVDLQNNTNSKSNKTDERQYDALFDDEDDHDLKDTFDMDNDENISRPLTKYEANQLLDYLKDRRLPGLSDREQIHLLAMIDTFVEISSQGESLDENGARFTALLENHFHLNKILPPDQRKQNLESRDMAYALHSQSQDLLLDRCIKLCGGKLLWEDARSLGIFLWLQKIDVVKEQVAAIARNIYLSKEEEKDPVDCTLLYLALRKKALLQSLWRSASFHKEQRAMITFLANDFTEPRWQKAASKNAFVLLGRQRFEYAAAFFLLGGKLKDAVNVILKNLKDFHLAIAVCRVYDGDDSPLLKDILVNYVIPLAIETNDRWLLTISYWLLGQTHDAVRSIVVPLSQIKPAIGNESSNVTNNITTIKANNEENDSAAIVNDPTLFILYQHVARAYERLGCPLLSLYVLSQHSRKLSPTSTGNQHNNSSSSQHENDISAETATTKSGENGSRAVDLFAGDDDDIFAPKTTGKESRAADLFADDDDDIFASKTNTTDDIFADMGTKPTSTDIFATSDDDDDRNSSSGISAISLDGAQLDNGSDDISGGEENLRSYKILLVVRMLQSIYHSASAMYHAAPNKISVAKYRNQYLDNRQALFDLGEMVGLDKSLFSRLLMEKSIESDVFPVYFDILDKCIPDDFNVIHFLASFELGCFQIFEAVLLPRALDFSAVIFMEHWIDDVISTFSIWSNLMKIHIPALETPNRTYKICLTAYVCLILVTAKKRHFEKTWTLLYHFSDFMDHIYDDDPAAMIATIFEEISNNEAKLVEMDPEDFESFSDESVLGFDLDEERYKPLQDFADKSTGAIVLELASLNFVLFTLEQGMHFSKNSQLDSDELVDFVWTTLLDPIAYRVHCLNIQLDNNLDHDLTKKSVLRHFRTLRQKRFWHSIKTLIPFAHLLPFVRFSPAEVNVLPDEAHHPHSNTVYNAGTTIHAFCINLKTGASNKLGDVLAVCTKSEIQEIDMSNAQRFSAPLLRAGSNSSKDRNIHEYIDSYPDTEEELDSVASDGELEGETHHLHQHQHHQHHQQHHHSHHHHNSAKSPVPGIRRPLHHPPSSSSAKSSAVSTPISPMNGRLLQPEDRINHSSFDNLQETLRRSLGVGKEGSEASRSPTGISSVGSVAEHSECVVTLKRNIAATCAETHPEYPFYITGCEVSNDGPSAILWQFGQEREITNYYGCHGKVTRVHFDPFGQKFGAGDTTGALCLWKFDSYAQPNKPYYSTTCHSKATRDFIFMNSSSLLATAGTSVTMSRRRDHLCIWDTLLPPSSSMVCSLPGHDSGAYAVAYEGQGHLLFSGGKRGEIVVSDIRQRSTMHTFTAHSSRIRSIAIDTQNHTLITGSIDGELKIWDASTYKQKQVFDIQPRNRFLAPSFNRIPLKAFGVTQIQLVDSGSYIYTSGPGGIIRCSM
ncbi:RAVE protein 1 C terminal-domain-containing protein [Absidia repens]|uniref:RAVE protein 1 C terminal-domain-containing protein n=1 Tax=Absidia repens TaxID=90262 RepID=A0A1X2IXS0_9FUNG|nr:RAVE protein 1 C terminal-domain-containing protein [Absidia repens]